ncbi:MAG: cytochrome c1 [Pseudomonadota bacterium]
MFKLRILPLLLGLALAPGAALAAGGSGYVEDHAFSFEGPFGSYDRFQLQRGFQVYQEVCSGCHGLKHVAFRELGSETGPAFPEDQVKAIAAMYDVPDPDGEPGDTRAGRPSDKFPENNAAGAPDLSMMAKGRAGFHGPHGLGTNQLFKGMGGAEYIRALLLGYTGEEEEIAGSILYENTVMAGGKISMAPPLYGEDVEYAVYGGGDHGGYTPPEPTLEQHATDVAAFLMWAAEPKLIERKEAGVRNVIWLAILAILLYYTNKKLWAPIKREDA